MLLKEMQNAGKWLDWEVMGALMRCHAGSISANVGAPGSDQQRRCYDGKRPSTAVRNLDGPGSAWADSSRNTCYLPAVRHVPASWWLIGPFS